MDVALSVLAWFLFHFVVKTYSVPPDACFSNFQWQDCGMPPKPVIYYYKPGSRCEVGMWRGCLPNPNMFVDEYECVQTCIFAVRAKPDDWHNQNEIDNVPEDSVTTESGDDTTTDGTDGIDGSTSTPDERRTPVEGTTDSGDPAEPIATAEPEPNAEGETATETAGESTTDAATETATQ